MKKTSMFDFKLNRLVRTDLFKWMFLLFVPLVIESCGNNASKRNAQSKQIDTLECWVDSSLMLLSSQLNKSYENVYDFPRFDFESHDEMDIVAALIDNKINLAILHRLLDSNEVAYLKKKENFTPKQYEFGFDAYVFITSVNSDVQTLDLLDFESFLKAGQSKVQYTLCVENAKSQALTYLKSHYHLDTSLGRKLFTLGSLEKMMDYVRKNPGSIGLIPFSLISDIEAKKTLQFLNGLKVMNVTFKDSKGKIKEIEPSQSSITTRDYPLVAPMVLVNCNMEKKTGTNFVNYIFKTKAQRLIQKFGLVPAVFPGREVVIHQ